MKYKVLFYCPDRHISYDIRSLENTGVGGGATARVRIAHALARRGHQVTLYINCPRERTLAGVLYRHFSHFDGEAADIFIATTSGGGMDLKDLHPTAIHSRIKVLMLHGVDLPKNAQPAEFDCFYLLSNFIRKKAVENWQVDPQKIFVTHRGVTDEYYCQPVHLERDRFALVYLAHPSKGLDAAVAIWRSLKELDGRFSLHVFGGNRLWGEHEQPVPAEPGLVNHGLTGQKRLARDLRQMSFSLNLQSREEPFGMAVIEAMRAGCIVLASPVGAYPEIIHNGYDGFLIPGQHTRPETQARAVRTIIEVLRRSGYMNFIHRNAMHALLTWDMVAEAWEGHWDWLLDRDNARDLKADEQLGKCALCQGNLLPLADGLHCLACGHYQRSFDRWKAE